MMLSLLKSPSIRQAEKQIANANSYAQWAEAAQEHDQISGKADWKKEEQSDLYDNQIIRTRLDGLRKCRADGDDRGLLFILNEGIHGNLGGMGNSALHAEARFGTKELITEYIDEIADALEYLGELDSPDIAFEEKIDFFHRASHCFGRTALMLSGGAALGNFHLGVIKTLVEEDLMPRVISGASAGSIFAASVGTNTREQLKDFFKVENLLTASKQEANVIRRLWDNGYQKINRDGVEAIINSFVRDYTFDEAYKLTHQHINITVSPAEQHQKPRLLNAITSPNVLVRSAVMASVAVPGVFPPVTLMAKGKDGDIKPYLPLRKWVDGSFSDDLPAKRLARLYGVNHYIVSLTNPFVLPFIADPAHTGEIRQVASRLFRLGMREYGTVMGNLNRRYMKGFPRIETMLSLYYSVLSQSYTGDINITYQFYMKDPRRLLTLLTPDEMMEMIHQGDKATWPKIEAIRSCTKIGRILYDLLDNYEQRELSLAQAAINKANRSRKHHRAGKLA
jgi:TAG lipase/steryl ester hydrolase/phospholipase A2/LPA acyltransferase